MKSCFVIMPISDTDSYPEGHFKRVYEYIIKPACDRAGFVSIRADDILNTNYIAIDVVRRILTSEMAICDLSSRNPNVFYELGIRQAFNMPVTIIKDNLTDRVFDIQGFRDIVYDENLRIDNVESVIDRLVETLTNTYESRGQEINSLISLLGIQPAQLQGKIEISKETEIILNAVQNLGLRIEEIDQRTLSIGNSIKIPSPQYDDINSMKLLTTDEFGELKIGEIIYHAKFGKGQLKNLSFIEDTKSLVADIDFLKRGPLKIMVNYAKLYIPFNTESS